MASPAQVVAEQFASSTTFAASANTYAANFVAELNRMATALKPPAFDPALTPPDAPSTVTPGALSSPLPIVFTSPIKPANAPSAPTLSQVYPIAPTAPTLPAVDMPAMVLPSLPATPTLNLAITAITAPAVSLPTEPTLVDPVAPNDIAIIYPSDPDTFDTSARLLQPTSYSYAAGATYASALLQSVIDSIKARLNGGTGLATAVEDAIWNRARSREAKTAQANQDDVVRTQESRGFALPTGALAAQAREGQRDYYGKVSELSRDIAIKQADLEQSNAQKTIDQGMQMESKLIEYANQIEQRTFDSARYLAENAVAIYNAQIAEIRVIIDAYNTNATIFRAKIDLQQARIEDYKARLQAYTAKIGANSARIEMYRARISANESIVNLYRAELEGNKILVEIEQVKAAIFGEQIRAYSAAISGEVAKLEAPKVQAQVNSVLTDVYKAQVDGYAAAAGVENARAKNEVDIYDGQIRALTAQWQGYAAAVAGEGERVRALASVNSDLLERDRTAMQRDIAQFEQAASLFRTQIAVYESQSNINMNRTKTLSDQYFAITGIAAEAAKVGAQVNAQLAASAYSTIKASASVSGNDSINWNYAGKIASEANPF